MGSKGQLGKSMVTTYAHGSVVSAQMIVFGRQVYSLVGCPIGWKEEGKIVVAVISPSAISALNGLTAGELVSVNSAR